MFEVHIHMN